MSRTPEPTSPFTALRGHGSPGRDERAQRTRHPAIRALLWLVFFTLAAALPLAGQESPPGPTRKVLLLVSDIGSGHLSAAKAIEERVRAEDPSVEVVTRNIRDWDYQSEWKERLDRKLYWYIVKKYPRLFTKLYTAKMNKGRTVPSLAAMVGTDLKGLGEYIQEQRFDVAVAVHYGAATSLTVLRERGSIPGVRLGWLNTDYITEYFPRFGMDKFFLGHDEVTRQFQEAGVDPGRLETTGIPVSEQFRAPFDREAFMGEVGLDPSVKTVVMSAGAEGTADFTEMVRQLAQMRGPLQIVAVTGRNAEQKAALEAMELPSNIRLVPEGFIPVEKVVGYVRSSDLYVTKSGGLMPTEAFTAGVPTIVLDVYGGHEKVNARLFGEIGVAEVVDDTYEGFLEKAERLLSDQQRRQEMLASQARFQAMQDFDKVTRFIMDPADRYLAFGQEGGRGVEGAEPVLRQLDRTTPDLQILLSYNKGEQKWHDANPFGHLGLEVDGKVYTANGLAVWNVERDLIHTSSLADYLYSVTRPVKNGEFTDVFGEAYVRDVIGVKVWGVPPEKKQAILDEYEKIQREWRRGVTRWHKSQNNCADLVARALEAGGFEGLKAPLVTLPLTVYERFLREAVQRHGGQVEVVKYEKVPGAETSYKLQSFPLNLRSMVSGWSRNQRFHEGLISRVVRYDPSKGLVVEETGRGLSGDPLEATRRHREELLEQARVLATQEKEALRRQEEIGRNQAAFDEARDRLASLSETDRTALEAGRGSGGVSPRQYGRWKAELSRHRTRLGEYFALHDEVSRGKNELGLELVRNDLEAALRIVEGQPYLAGKKVEALRAHYEKLLSIQAEYYRYRRFEGEHFRDAKRIAAVRDFHAQAAEMARAAEPLLEHRSLPQRVKETLQRLLRRVRTSLALGRAAIKVSPALGNAMASLLRPGSDRSFGEAVKDIYARLRENSGMDVTVERGRPPEQGKPVLYVLNHRDPWADHMAAFPEIEGRFTIVGQADVYGMPRPIRRRVLSNADYVGVGSPTLDPAKRIVEVMDQGRSVVIYPEGSISTPLGESRPFRPNFAGKLLPDLLKKGKFQIVPVTLDDTGVRIGEEFDMTRTHKKVRVVIGDPVSPETLAVLYEVDPTGELATDSLRMRWHQELSRQGDGLPGQMPVEEWLTRLRDSGEMPLEARTTTPPLRLGTGEARSRTGEGTSRASRPEQLSLFEDISTSAEGGVSFLPGELERIQTRLFSEYVRLRTAGKSEAAGKVLAVLQEVKAARGEGGGPGRTLSRSGIEGRLRSISELDPRAVDAVLRPAGERGPTEGIEARSRRLRRRGR